jgi:hypothetical protein
MAANYLGDNEIVVTAEDLKNEIKELKVQLHKAQLETTYERLKAARDILRLNQEKKDLKQQNLKFQQDIVALRIQVEDQKNKPDEVRISQLATEIRQLEYQLLELMGVSHATAGVIATAATNVSNIGNTSNLAIATAGPNTVSGSSGGVHSVTTTNATNLLASSLSGNLGGTLGSLESLDNLGASVGGSLGSHMDLQFTCQQSGMVSAYDYYQEYHEGKNGCKSLIHQYNDARQALKELRHRSDDKRSTGKYTMKSIKNNTTYSRRSTFVNKMDKFIQEQKELGNDLSPKALANRIDRYAEYHKRTVADLVRNPGWDEQSVFNYLE